VYDGHTVKRTNVHLTVPQLAALAQRAKATGLSVAELIRRAVDAYLRRSQ
jgi:post-segregation antitoxin (ccd killing protein)